MDLKAIFQKWQPKAEAYFSTLPWKNILFFLFFLVMAFIFWLMLFFQKENVEGIPIPLKYTNIPKMCSIILSRVYRGSVTDRV